MKKIYLTILFTLAASVGMSWATPNSITINESSHGSVVASSSSAAAGETITLTATPDDGYQLKSISGVYETQATSSETINSDKTKTTVTGTKFQCVGTSVNTYGWRVYNPGTANTLTVSSKDGTTLIEKIEFTSTWGNSRANNMLSVSAGTLSFNGTPATTVTINNINATSVTISGSGINGGTTWCIKSVKVYYTATIENELEISDTQNANVKTFTMVDREVTISAEFEPNVYTVAGSSAVVFGSEWDTDNEANNMVLNAGVYTLTKEDVTLPAGTIEFKVVTNHAWSPSYPADNYVLNIAVPGIHNITITFNASTHAVNASDELILPTVKVAGSFITDGWDANAVVLTPAQDKLTASGSVVLPTDGSYEMKVVVGNDWKTVGNVSNWLTRVNNEDVFSVTGGMGNNTHIDMDMVGEYSFTYTYATGALTVSYPQSYTRHFDHAYYSTICLPQAATLTNATAYTVASIADGYVSLSAPVNGLVAGTPYIIKPDADDVDVIATMSGNPVDNTVPGANGLWGILDIGGASSIDNGNYILSENKFHLVDGGTVDVPRFRGALWVGTGSSAPELRIAENATDIRNIEGNENAVKFIENGKLFIRKNGVVYDATGAVVK